MKQMENEMIVSVPLEVVKASEIEPREVKWLWYPYIPFGKVTLLQGDPGDGKSKLMLSIAALLSKGEPLPFTDEETEPMTIIYQTTEDDADDTVVPRFNSAGGNGENLIFIKEDEKSLSFGDNRIAEAIEKYHAKLLILDPMSSYIGENCSMNNANETRAEFNHLIAVAKNNGWASIFPIVSIVFVYYIVYMGAVANTSQTTMMGGILYAFILISNICFFLGEVATEKRYLTAEEYKQMMFEQEKTEAVMNLQEQHLKEMKGLIHDFEAQLNGLQLLARENKSEAFKKSIEEVRESIQERNDFYFVESKALQLILNQTNELCIKYGIEFCADIRYGNFLFMTFPDVFSLFENALCNAVNACLQLGEEEKKRIELRVFRQHEQIVVLLANTYNIANTRSNTYALHPHHEHGYGIQNIKRVIRKYNGTYLVKKEDVYKLMISFPLDVGNVKI